MKDIMKIIEKLQETHPDASCELNFKTPFQLLIATLLSAQATDKSVNQLTSSLFVSHPDLDSFLKLTQSEIESKIRVIGLYRNKAKSIYGLCQKLQQNFNGIVPKELNALMSLPGVGRKTASVVQSVAYGIPAVAVDTHVLRVSNRIGLTSSQVPDKVSDDLMGMIPKEKWIITHHLLIFHGRRICKARKPLCDHCPIEDLCQKVNVY